MNFNWDWWITLGSDLVNYLRTDAKYRVSFDPNETFFSIATNLKGDNDVHNRWTFLYAELLKLILEFCPEPIKIAWDMVYFINFCYWLSKVSSRLSTLQPEEGSKSQEDLNLVWWRNYIVFACATVNSTESKILYIFYFII